MRINSIGRSPFKRLKGCRPDIAMRIYIKIGYTKKLLSFDFVCSSVAEKLLLWFQWSDMCRKYCGFNRGSVCSSLWRQFWWLNNLRILWVCSAKPMSIWRHKVTGTPWILVWYLWRYNIILFCCLRLSLEWWCIITAASDSPSRLEFSIAKSFNYGNLLLLITGINPYRCSWSFHWVSAVGIIISNDCNHIFLCVLFLV